MVVDDSFDNPILKPVYCRYTQRQRDNHRITLINTDRSISATDERGKKQVEKQPARDKHE